MLGGFERNLTDFSTDVFQLEPESWLFFSNAEKQLQESVEPETQALSLTLSTWMTCGDSELKSTSADLIYSGILWIIWDFLILLSCFSWCCSHWELPGNLHLSVTSDIRLGAVDLDSSSLSPLAFSSQSRFDLMNKNVSCEKKELMLTSRLPLLPSWPSALWFWPGVAILMSSGVNASLFDSVVCCKSFHKRQKPARAWESLDAAHFPNDKGWRWNDESWSDMISLAGFWRMEAENGLLVLRRGLCTPWTLK